MKTKFKVSQIRELLNQVYSEKITFSRFVEILNEQATEKTKFNIKQLDQSHSWVVWLEKDNSNGLNESGQSDAFRDIYKKINEIVESVNQIEI